MDSIMWTGDLKIDWIDLIIIMLSLIIIYKLFKGDSSNSSMTEKEFLGKINECKHELTEANNLIKSLSNDYNTLSLNYKISVIVLKIQNIFLQELQKANIEIQSFSSALDKLERMTRDVDYAKDLILENVTLIDSIIEENYDEEEMILFLDKLNEI